jgi:uncharacterized protein (TIGR03000 family)
MSIRNAFCAFLILVLSAAVSPAQNGAGTYNSGAVPPRWSGVYPGFYGGYFPGFYSNGFSMYGPPVPTYGPVPGTFGGSDQRMFTYDPSLYPRGYGYRPLAAAPRPSRAPSWSNPPRQRNDDPAPELAPAPKPLPSVRRNGAAPVVVEVVIPEANATVVIDGQATQQSGARRRFESPALPSGKMFEYEVRARWQANGQAVVQTRTVEVRAGERVVVDLTQPEPAARAENR